MTRSGPHALALAAVLSASALASCGNGRDVELGAVVLSGSTGPDEGGAGSGRCGEHDCSDHTGSVVFVDASAADATPSVFDTAPEHPAGTDLDAEPALLYPSDETLVPVNASLLRFAWTPGRSDLFAVDFGGPNTIVRVLTRETSFSATPEQWSWIAESNRGARVSWVVRGVDSGSALESWRSSPRVLTLSASALDGTVYYWSTGSRGLMRARLDRAAPVRFFTDPAGDSAGACTGCHTVSRDGTRLAAGYDKNQLAEISLVDRSTLLPAGTLGAASAPMPAMPGGPMAMMDAGAPAADPAAKAAGPFVWSTFSPDGKRLLVAGGGKLRLLDADTGAVLGAGDGTVMMPPGTVATHPDWSPLGDQVALTLATKGGDKQTEGGSIALMAYADDAFDVPRVLVAAAGDHDNDFFPSFSPDGRFIAYVNAAGPSQDAASAELRLVDVATGTVWPLTRLNQRVNGEDGVTGIGNTMPTWAPSDGAGTYWLAFSSLRAYADVRSQDAKQDQLWLAGLDPTLDDPGFAALWAPFQNLGQGNHRAFWTTAIAAEPNACGTVCAPRETCDNGLDDDCDCVVDDCSQEICDDGIDNDGDGKTDKMDLACAGP